jgi:hypothetical protein
MEIRWYHYLIYDLRLRLALFKLSCALNYLMIFLRLKKEPPIRLIGWTGKMYVSNKFLTAIIVKDKDNVEIPTGE